MIRKLPSEDWNKLKEELAPYWHEVYFLLLALDSGRHLKEVYIAEDKGKVIGILAIRKSNKAHLHMTAALTEEWTALLKSKALKSLLVSERVYRLISGGDLVKAHHRTSLIMTRYEAPFDMQDTLTPLSIEELSEVDELYRMEMPGALSLEGMRRNYEKGGFGVGIRRHDKLVSVAQVSEVSKDQGFVFGVVVIEKFRGQGLGKRVMQGLLSLESSKGLTLHLLTDNPLAIGLYEQLGFKANGKMIEAVL
ncbi:MULTISPECIES: GNAT family N-acetyltransferase [unclassified Fusibacter]|uniref:GNAT family N-acetyltransferase n=1 Tax=unclassified Fusibacter TaxID=2624464 RepID=UPI0010114E23|nr:MULTISPECIES: GNAT family N-acetyltransferase [unclassified Fusibacter]MCK8060805.1 GNAT family N-acetyltransferase [Fusibacter sp. A2]NPE23101.1 GNAT family N-acetyltransferase [Fusibacter sp. A1]RXV59772.1 GNAT family N-acetyltransferase [Fusibacter sp. A1]